LSDDEIGELRDLTRKESPEEAVRVAITEYRRYALRMRLIEAAGQVTMEDNWRLMEQAEIDEAGSH
jgi:hypothetical protein